MTDIEYIRSIFYQVRPVVSHLQFFIPVKPLTPSNIGEALKGPQRKLRKEYLFVKYDKNKNFSLLSDSLPIKYLPYGTKVLWYLISTSIMECECSYAWKFVALPCANGSSWIQGVDFYHHYSPVSHAEYFRTNISIPAMNRPTARILDANNDSQYIHFPINERVCFITPPYYLDWFEKAYLNVPVNRYDGNFFIQCMNESQGTKTNRTKMESTN